MLYVQRAVGGRTAAMVRLKRFNYSSAPMADAPIQPAQPPALRWSAQQSLSKLREAYHCVLEVHDARIPGTGRCAETRDILTKAGRIPYVLVLNKKDRIGEHLQEDIRSYLRRSEGIQHVCFTNCLERKCSVRRVLPVLTEVLLRTYKAHTLNVGFNVLIVGSPRSGKNSLLQNLNCNHFYRNDSRRPELQQLILQRKHILCDNPLIYADSRTLTVPPQAVNERGVMKLNIMGYRRYPHHIDAEFLCEYMLALLNRGRHYNYLRVMGVKRPTMNVRHVLQAYCQKQRLYVRQELRDGGVVQSPNYRRAAEHMLASFRSGALGPLCLDLDNLMQLNK